MELSLFLNHRCNLRCRYCYTGRKVHRPMPAATARRAVDLGLRMADRGFLLLAFFGGEPLLEVPRMTEALGYARRRCAERGLRLFTQVATNGTVLNDEILALLRAFDFQVQVSLDGCPEAQDATRRFRNGRSSQGRVERNLLALLRAGFQVRLVAVIDPANVAFLGQSFDYLMDLGLTYIHFSPNYLGAWDEAACEAFELALQDLGRRYKARLRAGQDVRLDPLNGKIVTHLNRGYKEKNLCQFGQQEICVAPSGRIYPCDRLVCEDDDPQVCIGDLQRGIDTARRDELVRRKNTPDAECQACALRPRCMHWCGCANYETTGDTGQVSPVVCWFERSFLAAADAIAGELFAEQTPAFLRRFYIPQLPPQA